MPPSKHRKPGPQAIVHREHRRKWGPLSDIGFLSVGAPSVPQYQSGPRHGQQLALIRSYGGRP